MAAGIKTGGRKPGTPNKVKKDLFEAIKATLSEDEIDRMSPAEILLHIARTALRNGQLILAASAAKDAAPYYNVRLAPKVIDAEASDQINPSDDSDPEILDRSLEGNQGEADP